MPDRDDLFGSHGSPIAHNSVLFSLVLFSDVSARASQPPRLMLH
jgi:hypothetical protein